MAPQANLFFDGVAHGATPQFALTVLSIVALLAITQFAPNSQQWLGYDPDRTAEEQSWGERRLAYPLRGAVLGGVMVFTLTQMSAVQSFLYFQF
jgi:hypothetical protein